MSFIISRIIILLPVSLAFAAFDCFDSVMPFASIWALQLHTSADDDCVDAMELHQLAVAQRLDVFRVPRHMIQRETMTQTNHVHQWLLSAVFREGEEEEGMYKKNVQKDTVENVGALILLETNSCLYTKVYASINGFLALY